MTLKFDEEYYALYDGYEKDGHFEKVAIYIRDVIKPFKGVIDFGGALGHVSRWLNKFGIKSITVDSSRYCYDNHVCKDFSTSIHEINFKEYDVLFSSGVLSSIPSADLPLLFEKFNGFQGTQLHIFSCDSSEHTTNYIEQGYSPLNHEYVMKQLPTAHLICWDCRKTIQGKYGKFPIWSMVSE